METNPYLACQGEGGPALPGYSGSCSHGPKTPDLHKPLGSSAVLGGHRAWGKGFLGKGELLSGRTLLPGALPQEGACLEGQSSL